MRWYDKQNLHNDFSFFLWTLDFRIIPFFARSVVQQIVKLLSALHSVHKIFLDSLLFQVTEKFVDCFHCDSQCRNWINYAVVSVWLECFDIDVRCFTELSHVGQKEDVLFVVFELLSYYLELFCGIKTLGENHVCSCVNETFWSLDAFIKSVNSFCISSGTNDELTIRNFETGLSWDSDFINHLSGRNQLFSVQVTTSFGKDLVFNVKSRSSTVKEFIDSSGAHFTLSEASISIGNDWKVGKSGNIFDDFREFIQGSKSDIRDTRGGSQCPARDIKRLESMLSSQSGNKSIVASRNHEAFGAQEFSELLASVDELHLWLCKLIDIGKIS